MLVLNDTLGAFLAACFVLGFHLVYIFIKSLKKFCKDEQEQKKGQTEYTQGAFLHTQTSMK